jgi:hypothetical protein
MAGVAVTRYDASFPATGGGDEKAVQSRPNTSQSAFPQRFKAEGPEYSQTPKQSPVVC